MRAYSAIVFHTVRSAVRSHFFLTLLPFFLAAVFLLPMIVLSDGTALGLIRITLEYSFGAVALLLGISTMWLSVSEITADAANSRLQMIVVKPVGRLTVFAGKLTGVVAIHAVLLLFAGLCIYGLTLYRAGTADFTPEEHEQVYDEVLVGRRIYAPEIPDMQKEALAEFQRQLKEARARGLERPEEWETVRNKQDEYSDEEVLDRIWNTQRYNRDTIRSGELKSWVYRGLPSDLNGPIRVRYRLQTSDVTGGTQTQVFGAWGWRYNVPLKTGDQGRTNNDLIFLPKNGSPELLAFDRTEFELPRKMLNDDDTAAQDYDYVAVRAPVKLHQMQAHGEVAAFPDRNALMTQPDGTGVLLFQNLTPGKAVYLHENAGPYLLIPEISFFENFMRGLLALFLEILFVAVLSMSIGACFSLPTSLFLTISYFVICFVSRFINELFEGTVLRTHTVLEAASLYGSNVLEYLLSNPDDFSVSGKLASGVLIEWSFLGELFLYKVFLKLLPLLLAGLFVYWRRELALINRK